MSRRNQKARPHKPVRPAPHPASPREPGLKAFHAGNYAEAIRLWSELGPESSSAVAEAHFRRAVTARPGMFDPLPDLRRAIELEPGEARYWYHLGLAQHRAGRLEEARQSYARAAELGMARRGIGYVRGLAELETSLRLDLGTLPWLTPADRAALEPVAALLRGDPQGVPPAAPDKTREQQELAATLWQGMALLMAGDVTAARFALAPPKGQRLPAAAESVRALYYGLATAMTGDAQAALAAWTEAARITGPTTVARSPRLSRDAADMRARRVYELQGQGRWAESLEQAQAGLTILPQDPWLLRAALLANNRLAEKAREAGDWAAAIDRWQAMRAILEAHPALGPVAPALHNLAIAYEALEQWEPAAETWAALLSTLPRARGGRPAKKQIAIADGISAEEKRGWLRRRILIDYTRAERPDQAISYYKQAIKADPDNLDLRQELVSALLANEQTIAARNEVQRILEKDPNNLGALLLQAEVHEVREEAYAAEQALRRILAIDPKHEVARKGISHLLLQRGMNAFNSGRYQEARSVYTDALKYDPDDPQLLVFLAQTELVLRHAPAARTHIETALKIGTPVAYRFVFRFWVRQQDEKEAQQVLERAEAAGVASPHFYVDVGADCLTAVAPPPPSPFERIRRPSPPKTASKWETLGRSLIRKALDSEAERVDVLHHIVGNLGPAHAELAVEYVRELLPLVSDDPEEQMNLALMLALGHDTDGAKKTLTQAERLARQQRRHDLIEKIVEMRREISSPMFAAFGSLLALGGPDLFGEDDDDY